MCDQIPQVNQWSPLLTTSVAPVVNCLIDQTHSDDWRVDLCTPKWILWVGSVIYCGTCCISHMLLCLVYVPTVFEEPCYSMIAILQGYFIGTVWFNQCQCSENMAKTDYHQTKPEQERGAWFMKYNIYQSTDKLKVPLK